MRKHGWELPYHPLQVVAVAVFLALGFAFYVFFAPFVGKKQFEYVVVALYTPLVASVFCLYVWCTAANAVDPGVLKYKKYLNMVDNTNHSHLKGSRHEGGSTSSMNKDNASTIGDKPLEQGASTDPVEWRSPNEFEQENASCYNMPVFLVLFGWCPLSPQWNWNCSREQASKHASSEDGMFYCSLCEAEVCKYSKHCRVCDKCVDGFDHHCRWLNNCIGRKNYWGFFILMLSALLLLVLQWSLGIVLLICCFLERKRFAVEIPSKLGSSFTLVPFVVVVAFCTFLAMVATLPLAQLFSFHVLLIKKGISTYDYIMVLREQEQLGVGGQSPQMSPVSSATGLSTASSFTTFQRGAWCTPPRLFLEDQFDAILPENSASKRMAVEEHNRSKNTGTIKISPWTLVRLNTEEVSKVAAQARRKSRTLQPVVRREAVPGQETDSSIGSSGHLVSRLDNRRHATKRAVLPADLPLESLTKRSASATNGSVCDIAAEASTSLAPLQLDARRAFHINKTMTFNGLFASSPDSNLDSPGLHSLRVSSSGAEDCQGLATIRSTSDGYEASGGEDSDRIPSRITHRSSNWRDLVLSSGHDDTDAEDILRASYSEGMQANNGGRF